MEISPEEFGLTRCTLSDIKTGTPDANAEAIQGVFAGTITGARRDAILFNAAGALIVGGKADGFNSGISLAEELIDSGGAAKKLRELREMSGSFPKSI
jgi:anthranilate phosphoribosyltransferase